MGLTDYFKEHQGEWIDDLDLTVRETVEDGLVDVIGERQETPVFITYGSDEALYDTGKVLTVLQETPRPRRVQYVTPEAHRLVAENLHTFIDDDELACYAAAKECGVMRFTPFGPEDEQGSSSSIDSLAAYLIDEYASNDREKKMLTAVFDAVYD